MPQFVKDVEEIRQRAIHKIEEGPVTDSYGVDRERAIVILNEALATEIVCVLRYMHHYFMSTGIHGMGVADEFKEHADAEREHADKIAERIQQLGGKPDFNPRSLVERSASQYVEGETLADMIREDLIAERVVIEVYTEMIRFFGEKDPTTRRMVEDILADEEEHAADLTDLLYVVDPRTGQTAGLDPGTNPLQVRRRLEGEGRPGMTERSQERQRGVDNRQATEQLESGSLRKQAGSHSTDTHSPREEAEMRPARATRAERPAADRGAELAPANEPGTRGRAPRKGSDDEAFEDLGDVRSGEEGGSTRAAHVTNPSRKRKKVA